MDDATQTMPLGDRLAWTGLIVVTMLCLARAMIEHDPFPWWQSDPFVFSPPLVGLTPRWALLLNLGLVLGCCVSLLGHAMRGRGLSLLSGCMLAIALGVLGYHAIVDIERLLESSTIIAVASVLACASMAHTLPDAKRVIGSIILGFGLLLVCVGFYEIYVSHPLTLEAYELGRDSFLAARGWSPDSFEAMSYERRLRNPEPVAWFGLTNVFASFSAASAAGLFGLMLCALRASRPTRITLFVAACLCGFGLVMTGSKGGYGVLLIGLVFGIAPKLGKSRLLNGRVILLVCLCVLGALLIRGMLGEHLSERSLLFRWQYIVGSFNIWIHHPLVGCGPGLYQQQYALLKPDLSPEDVASAHNFVFDWLAVLGVGGLALLAFTWRIICGISMDTDHDVSGSDRPALLNWHWKLGLLAIALPLLVSLNMQSPVLNLSAVMPVLIGAGLWGGVVLLLIRQDIPEQCIQIGLIVSAVVLCVHGMLEVTGSLITSAPLWALMIGTATRQHHETSGRWRVMPVVLLLTISVVLSARWNGLNRWERSLHTAAWSAQHIASINTTLNALESSPNPQEELRLAQSLLRDLSGRPVSASLDSIITELNRAEVEGRQASIDLLARALNARPSHSPTRVALSQQILWIASVAKSGGRDDLAERMWDQATGLFEGVELNAGGHRWAGSVWSGRASSWPDAPDRHAWLELARLHFEKSLELAPHTPQTAIQLMDNATERDDPVGAQYWAGRAMDLHQQTRLDPLRGLNAVDLERVQALTSP